MKPKKKPKKKEIFGNLKPLLISEVIKKGFPIAFIRGEADSNYGFFIENPKKIMTVGYAESTSLEEMSLIDLVTILEIGIKPGDEDWEFTVQEFKEESLLEKKNEDPNRFCD